MSYLTLYQFTFLPAFYRKIRKNLTYKNQIKSNKFKYNQYQITSEFAFLKPQFVVSSPESWCKSIICLKQPNWNVKSLFFLSFVFSFVLSVVLPFVLSFVLVFFLSFFFLLFFLSFVLLCFLSFVLSFFLSFFYSIILSFFRLFVLFLFFFERKSSSNENQVRTKIKFEQKSSLICYKMTPAVYHDFCWYEIIEKNTD